MLVKKISSFTRILPKFRGMERLANWYCPNSTFAFDEYYDLCLDKLNFRVRPSSHIGWSLFTFGNYESALRAIATEHVKSRETVIEVGANVGWHTLFFSKLVGPHGNVIAFEPSPAIYKDLYANVRRNEGVNNCDLRQLALSDTIGEYAFTAYGPESSNAGDGYLAPENKNPEYGTLIKVPVSTLDAQCIDRCDTLKIDVEGFEPAVLRGGIKTIQRCRPTIIFEHVQSHIQRAGENRFSLEDYFRALEYDLFWFNDRVKPRPLPDIAVYSGDVLALPRKKSI